MRYPPLAQSSRELHLAYVAGLERKQLFHYIASAACKPRNICDTQQVTVGEKLVQALHVVPKSFSLSWHGVLLSQ